MQDNSSQPAAHHMVSRISEQRLLNLLLLASLRPHILMANLWWRVIGKKLRARSRIDTAIKALPFAQARWMRSAGIDDCKILATGLAAGVAPAFCIHLHVSQNDRPDAVRRAVRSALKQSVAPLHVVITRENGAQTHFTNSAVVSVLPTEFEARTDGLCAALRKAREIEADWLVPFECSSRLARHALAAYSAHLLRHLPGDAQTAVPALLYGDECEIARLQPKPKLWLKPRWDQRMILSQDYVGRACALSVEPALDAASRCDEGRPQSLYELVLRIAENAPVEHVERITTLTPDGSWLENGAVTLAAVRRVMGESVDEIAPGPFGTVAVQFPLPEPLPTVSVIVATRDRVELLRPCVEGVLYATDYPALDLIIADNDSVEPETLRYMDEVSADPRVTVVRWPHPFNYSAINNFAANHAHGEYLCLLNNDIEVIEPNWLSAMMREALQPNVGAVGARLLYPDRSIQHAGVAIGLGNAAGHAHRALPEGDPGYFAQALIARGASAVTGACLLLAQRHFQAVGGLDEEHLAVAYNDVDLCLKLRKSGLAIIYTPAATLIHHESKSRGLDFAPEHLNRYMRELAVFQKRWRSDRVVDPWHHPQLDRASETYRA